MSWQTAWREAIAQEIALIAGLLLVSLLDLGWASQVLALVRLPLLLLLIVALGYAAWLARHRRRVPVHQAAAGAEPAERVRGA
ncbi:hypothetical protein [Kallotenue papyrolyticum]|uniref:hypothetical protein n=1 Tax=Kallotenue papyrolyticum TaxID=1325125 RepID=UPI0004923148|nr:hypothetical protein [Kallotenue papyrolyticum]